MSFDWPLLCLQLAMFLLGFITGFQFGYVKEKPTPPRTVPEWHYLNHGQFGPRCVEPEGHAGPHKTSRDEAWSVKTKETRCVTCKHDMPDHYGWVGEGPPPRAIRRSGCNHARCACVGWQKPLSGPAKTKETPARKEKK